MTEKKLEKITLKGFGETIVSNMKESLKFQALGIAICGVVALGYNAYVEHQNRKEGVEA